MNKLYMTGSFLNFLKMFTFSTKTDMYHAIAEKL